MAPPDQNAHPRQSLRLLMPRAAPYQAIFRLRGPSINHLGLTPNPLHEFRQDEHTRLQRVISVPAWPLLPDSDRRHPIDGPCQCSLRRQPVAFVRLEIRESHAGSWVQSLPLLLNNSPRVCSGNSLLCRRVSYRRVALEDWSPPLWGISQASQDTIPKRFRAYQKSQIGWVAFPLRDASLRLNSL